MKKGGRSGPERDARRAGQRREIGDQLRLVFVGKRERVGEDQAAFGIGVADLDGEALARGVDVARAEGGAGDRSSRRPESARAAAPAARASIIMWASASAVAAPPMSFFM